MTHFPVASTDRSATRRGRLARLLATAWLGFYVLAVGATPVLDALAGHGQEIVAHWEDASDDRCPPRHEEVGCQFAPVFAAGGLLEQPLPEEIAPWRPQATPRPAAAGSVWGSAQRAVPPSRGPPAA